MNKTLAITGLAVETAEGKEILRGVNLVVKPGEKHVIMGPNGGGKSTLAMVLLGHPGYKVTAGKIKLGNTDITRLPANERAKLGLFLGFQYPVEVPGVNFASFLRLAVNAKGQGNISPLALRKELAETAKKLAMGADMTTRALNEGFSGGEKKKSEILQMLILKPAIVILDEPDSGLDVDALRYIAENIAGLGKDTGMVLVTHYQRILQHLRPDFVHVLIKGKIVESGGAELAEAIEKKGYEKFQK